MAEERMEYHDMRTFIQLYEQVLDNYMLPIRTIVLHQQIVDAIDSLLAKDVNQTSSVIRVLKKYKDNFQDVIDMSDDEEAGENESEDTESDASSEET